MPQTSPLHTQSHPQKEATICPMSGVQDMSVLPVVELSAVSTTTLTNKSIGDFLTFAKQSPVPTDQSDAETSILYNKQIDSNNNTLAYKAQIGGSIMEVELF